MPGHWEGDLFVDSGNSQIATLVERQNLYVMLVKAACVICNSSLQQNAAGSGG